MNDNRSEIPAKAYINAQIIEQAERTGAFDEPTRQVENMWNLKKGVLKRLGIANSAHLAGLLYCLFVVPKELWLETEHHPVIDEIDEEKLLSLVAVEKRSKAFDKTPRYSLLRHLRNAIAHVRFTIIEGAFTFWDQDPKTSEEIFRATFARENLMEFIAYVGPLLANLRNKKLQTH